jgi:class 3 adenylate cyclase/tetratricopeptide (TPR) repeat protein
VLQEGQSPVSVFAGKPMRCTSCGSENPDSKQFCGDCGTPFGNRCPKCSAENPAGKKFCGDCGTALANKAAIVIATTHTVKTPAPEIRMRSEQLDASATADGERKTVTALFADIKGSTELIRDLDPEEARAIVDPVLRLMMEAAHRYGGYIAQSTGDGIFALFGAPLAHEDHPQRALHAALTMQQAIREHAASMAAQGRPAIAARVGVNSGEVVVRTLETGEHSEYTPIGLTAHLAARLQTVAPPGSVAVSRTMQRLCEGYFTFRGLGPTAVKGIGEPVEVYEVTGVGPLRTHFELSARRGLTRFVGREHELTELKRALELARSGHGQIVAVVAEAGTGKSRLVYEFKATLPSDCKVLEAYSVSHDKASAFLPMLELLDRFCGVEGTDEAAARREKIRARLAALDAALTDTLPYLFALLGITDGPDPLAQMDPRVKQRRTLEAIKRIIVRDSINQPLVVIFEDLHWIDGETQGVLNLLVDSISQAHVLLLVNYRPEYHHEWGGKSYYFQLRLDPLVRENASEMLDSLLGRSAELLPLKRMVIDKTQGNPFFIEEMVQALFEQGVLTRNGDVNVTQSVSMIRIPPTVQGVLASRIDRLPASEKDLLQTLAVLGKGFPLTLIKQVVTVAEDELSRMLADLGTNEFIYEQPAVANTEYVFKHALTQEVAYNSLLVERRKRLHLEAAATLEAFYRDRLSDHYSELIHHNVRGGDNPQAVRYLRFAAKQAFWRGMYEQALVYCEDALGLLGSLKEGRERTEHEIEIQKTLGGTLAVTKGFECKEAGAAFTRTAELSRETGNHRALMAVLSGMRIYHFGRNELHRGCEVAQEHLAEARGVGDKFNEAAALAGLGELLTYQGEFVAARENIETATALCESLVASARGGKTDWFSNIREYCAHIAPEPLWFLGFPDRARRRGEEALILAQDAGVAGLMTFPYALSHMAAMLAACREPAAVRQRVERLMAITNQYALHPTFLQYANYLRALALIEEGQFREAIEILRDDHPFSIFPLPTALAAAYAGAGQVENALEAANRALTTQYRSEYRHYEAEAHRTKGDVLLLQTEWHREEVEQCYSTAIEVARRQNAKSLELRATMSLARLLAKQGKRAEARTMLTEIYGWFTEGFDTRDLKEAKSLLDELSA